MTRNFFSSALLFGGFYLLVALITSFASFQLGQRVGELPSFGTWRFIQMLLSFVWLLILLKYFYHRKYWFAFLGVAVLITTIFIHFAVSIKVFSTHEITNRYIVATYIVLIADILFGVSLAKSEQKKRPWLKVAGIFKFSFGLLALTTIIWIFNSLTALHDGSANKITQWISIIEVITPILLLLNFYHEKHEAKKTSTNQVNFNSVIRLIVLAAFLSLSFFGYKLIAEIGSPSENNYNEYDKKLTHPFEARTHINEHGETLPYRLLIPSDYDTNKNYPLVISLHGSSGRGNDNVKQVSRTLFPLLLSQADNQAKYPAFVLVPQCPPNADWGGITYIKSVDTLVLEIILALEAEFSIDRNRIYITGISMGGFGVWHLISMQPDLFAAAVPICGAGDPEFADTLTDIPIWAFHGKKDRNVLVKGTRTMIKAIKHEGGDPKYTEYPEEAHHISSRVANTPGLLDWLFAQKRDSKVKSW